MNKRTFTTKLLSLLLSCFMLFGLIPTVASAASAPVTEIPIEKIVILGTDEPAPRKIFTFNLYEQYFEPLEKIGVEVAENSIATNGAGTYDGKLIITLVASKVTTENGWFQQSTETTAGLLYRDFTLVEQNDSEQGWTYSNKEYNVRIFYNPANNEATCKIDDPYGEADIDKATFTNKYGSDHTFSIPVEKTVEQGGTKTPEENIFTFELAGFDESKSLADYGITMTNSTVTTDGVGVFYGDLIGVIDPDMITEDNGWKNIQGSYKCEFFLKEVNDNEVGWEYSQKNYNIEIWFNPVSGNANATIYVDGDAAESTAKFTNIYTMDEITEVIFTVKKTDKDGNPLAGALFTLTGTGNFIDMNYEATSDENGIATFTVEDGFFGDLAEKTAPDGYIKSDETYAIAIFDGNVYFVKDDDTYTDYETVTFINEKKTIEKPAQTGDNSNAVIYIVLLFVSAVGVAGIALYSRKKKYLLK